MKNVRNLTYAPKKSKKKRIAITFMFMITAMLYILFQIEERILPIALKVMEYQCKNLALSTIQQVCNTVLRENADQYQNLYTIHQDSNGKIQSIIGDTLRINSLEDTLIDALTTRFKKTDQLTLQIPLGSITGIPLLNGFGPPVKIKIVPLSLVSSEIQSSFSSFGVNQTKLDVFLHLQLDVSALLAGVSNSIHIESDVCIAQIVIVGEVPSVYMDAE